MKHSLDIVKHREKFIKQLSLQWQPPSVLRSVCRHRRPPQCFWHPLLRFWRPRGISGNLGNCRVGKTLQMCNKVTNHCDICIFSRPDQVGDWVSSSCSIENVATSLENVPMGINTAHM